MQHNIIHELNVHNHPFNFSFASLATSRSIWRRAELLAPLLSSPAPVTLPQPDPFPIFPFTELLRALVTFAFSCSNSVLKCSRLHLEIVVWKWKINHKNVNGGNLLFLNTCFEFPLLCTVTVEFERWMLTVTLMMGLRSSTSWYRLLLATSLRKLNTK